MVPPLIIIFEVLNEKKEPIKIEDLIKSGWQDAVQGINIEKVYITWKVIEQFLNGVMVNKAVDENNLELANIIIRNILSTRELQLAQSFFDIITITYKNVVFHLSCSSYSLSKVVFSDYDEKIEWKYFVPDDFRMSRHISKDLCKLIIEEGVVPQHYLGKGRFKGAFSDQIFLVDTLNRQISLDEEE